MGCNASPSAITDGHFSIWEIKTLITQSQNHATDYHEMKLIM